MPPDSEAVCHVGSSFIYPESSATLPVTPEGVWGFSQEQTFNIKMFLEDLYSFNMFENLLYLFIKYFELCNHINNDNNEFLIE